MARCDECANVLHRDCAPCVQELEAKLAAALGALEKAQQWMAWTYQYCGVTMRERYDEIMPMFSDSLASEPPAVKRLRAIVAVMEARFKGGCLVVDDRPKFDSIGYCADCKDREACKAVQEEA